jgi:hypothetical protein
MLLYQYYRIEHCIPHVISKRRHMSTQIPLLPPSGPATASLHGLGRRVVNHLICKILWLMMPVISESELSFLPALREDPGTSALNAPSLIARCLKRAL